ncbi:hypothetical protein ABZ953_19815 [Streptomyces sp. NPDC046465]|uniref:hypothetical protein n=1 Tax=Streptomyces sp. NPDC046465 TaxID=3155810 RepID=UPI0033D47CCA
MKTTLVTALAAAAALLPGAANAAERHAVTVTPTARAGADGKSAVVSGTYTCEGYTGPVRLRVALRTEQTRPLNAAETETVKNLFQWLGVPGAPVPKTSTATTARTRTLDGTCDGSATAHRWEYAFAGPATKATKASVAVTMTAEDSRTAKARQLADTAGDVAFT